MSTNNFERTLVEHAGRFLGAADAGPEAREMLGRYGYTLEEHERGLMLVAGAKCALQAEDDGTAWNFLEPTPERRLAEARAWYRDRGFRYVRDCFRHAEDATGFFLGSARYDWPLSRKLTLGLVDALRHAAMAASPAVHLGHRAQLKVDLKQSLARPADAAPPKDTVLVELSGWYERWRLLVQRTFRGRPDVLAHFGLASGIAPPRLRGKGALRYGEGAGGKLRVINGSEGAEAEPMEFEDSTEPGAKGAEG